MNRNASVDADAPALDRRGNFAARVDMVTLKLFLGAAKEPSVAKAAEREQVAP